MNMRRVLVREAPIDLSGEVNLLREAAGEGMGALASFVGVVRGGEATLLELEHHPGMTEKSISVMVDSAEERWNLLGVTVIHRIGALRPGEDIVLVLVASAHRKDALEACDFLMDYLKTEAVLWKREYQGDTAHWVESTEEDYARKSRWKD